MRLLQDPELLILINKAIKKSFYFAILSIIVFSCSKDNGDNNSVNCTTVPKSFMTDVNPIVQNFCNTAGCHAPGSANGPGQITNYTEVFNNRVAIRASIASGIMPQSGTLTTSQKNSFLCWIDSGSPNN